MRSALVVFGTLLACSASPQDAASYGPATCKAIRCFHGTNIIVDLDTRATVFDVMLCQNGVCASGTVNANCPAPTATELAGELYVAVANAAACGDRAQVGIGLNPGDERNLVDGDVYDVRIAWLDGSFERRIVVTYDRKAFAGDPRCGICVTHREVIDSTEP